MIVEIASNDGYLLQYFNEKNYKVLGIEPAENIAKIAMHRGIPTKIAFFGEEVAKQLILNGQVPKLVICNNVLAHVPDFNDFVKLIYDTKKIPDKYPEKMFLKMSDILDIKLGTKLTIYKFEEIPDCIETLNDEFSIDGNYKYYNQSNKLIEKNITQETKELIYELYEKDFENFNYDINNIEEPTPTMPSLTSNNSSGYEEALKLFQIAEQEVLTGQK